VAPWSSFVTLCLVVSLNRMSVGCSSLQRMAYRTAMSRRLVPFHDGSVVEILIDAASGVL